MRLALLIYGSLDTISGGYLYDRKLVEALERSGDTVEILSLPWRGTLRHLADNLSPGLLQRLAGLNVDILLQDELNHPSLFWLNGRIKSRRGRRDGYEIVSIVHHLRSSEARPAWQNSVIARVERRYLCSVDGFIYNSRTTQRAVESLAGGSQNSVVAYPAGDRLKPQIGADEIARRARGAGPLRLFFLGNLIPRKGMHTLLEAMSRVPRELWRLEAAGSLMVDPTYTRSVQRQIEAYGLQGNISFLGPRRDAELAEDLKSSHVLVVPSSYEGFGIAYLEGMGFGLPAIASSSGAAGEIITHGQDGYLIAPGDAAGLANHLKKLALDRERLLAMSLAARRRFLAHPTWEESMKTAVDFLYRFGKL